MNKKITTALAAIAIAGFSGLASAWAPNSGAPDLQINMSGATAMDNSITSLFTELCEPGTLDSYFNDSANPGNAYRAFYCTLTANKVPGLSVSPLKVLFVKRSAGGSAQGVNPIIDQQRLQALNIFNNNCTLTPTANNPTRWLCRTSQAGDLELRYSDIGISDVDVRMFRGVNTPAGFNPVNPESANDLDSVSVAALIFGIPVNNSLYNALQYAQRQFGPIPSDCAIGEYSREECIPSLTKNDVASLMNGRVASWTQYMIDDGSANGRSLVDVVSDGIAGGVQGLSLPTRLGGTAAREASKNFVRYCKRVNGSGTGAQQYAKFLHNPCTDGAASPMQASVFTTGPIVIQNSGSGDIELCLNDYELGVNQTGQNGASGLAPLARAWAFGVQSLEKNDSNANPQWPYKFVKIDGVAPTLANAFTGKYMDVVEMTYQWLKPNTNKLPACDYGLLGTHPATCGPRPPEQDVKVIIDQMRSEASQPVVVGSVLNVASNYPFGKSGYMAPAVPFATSPSFTGLLNENAPIWPYTHNTGAGINNCVVPMLPAAVTKKPL
jgi:hypothetical protein